MRTEGLGQLKISKNPIGTRARDLKTCGAVRQQTAPQLHLRYLAEFCLEWEVFQTKVVENIKTHVLRPATFSENRAIYEIIRKDAVELDTS